PAGAARVDADHDVAVWDPALGIGDLPILVLVGRALEDLRMVGDHLLPLVRIAVLVGQSLGVDPVGEDDRVAPVLDRAEHVRAQHDAVVHRDRLVPRDPHAVADLGAGLDLGTCGHRELLLRERHARALHGLTAPYAAP